MVDGNNSSQWLDWMTLAVRKWRLQRRFYRKTGSRVNFNDPRTYLQKLQYRKLYGNHALYSLVADKYRVRQYVADRVGRKYLVPLLGVHDRLRADHFKGLPKQFIIKANHGSGWHQIVRDRSELNVDETIRYFNRRVRQTYGRRSGEFHYGSISPKIQVEELLLDDGKIPCDYALFCFNNSRGFDWAVGITSPCGQKSAHFDREWNVWENNFPAEETRSLVRPENFNEMVEVACALSSEFDFMRVDLYNVHGRIYFGELTCTPRSGIPPIDNERRADAYNAMWDLDIHNERLYRKCVAA